jgi:hypothetical protein
LGKGLNFVVLNYGYYSRRIIWKEHYRLGCDVSEERTASIFKGRRLIQSRKLGVVHYSRFLLTSLNLRPLKMEVVRSFETPVSLNKTAPRRIPADGTLHRKRRKNIWEIKSRRIGWTAKVNTWDTRIHTQFLSYQPLWRPRSRYNIKMDLKK